MLLRGRRGGQGVVSLEQDTALLPAQQQTIPSTDCAKVTCENPFRRDAAPARERAVGRARVAQVKNPAQVMPGGAWQRFAPISSHPDPIHAVYHRPAAPLGSAPAKRDGGRAKLLAGYPLPAAAELNL